MRLTMVERVLCPAARDAICTPRRLFNVTWRKVGGLTFVKIGRLTFSFAISRTYRPLKGV